MGISDPAPRCPGCGATALEARLLLTGQPIILNQRYESRTEALAAVCADILLRECSDCGLVWNSRFDSRIVPYDQQYENTQCHSRAFTQHLQALADGLIERFGIHGQAVLEVGCGKGDFLRLLCAREDARGFGYDRSFEGPARWMSRTFGSSDTISPQKTRGTTRWT